MPNKKKKKKSVLESLCRKELTVSITQTDWKKSSRQVKHASQKLECKKEPLNTWHSAQMQRSFHKRLCLWSGLHYLTLQTCILPSTYLTFFVFVLFKNMTATTFIYNIFTGYCLKRNYIFTYVKKLVQRSIFMATKNERLCLKINHTSPALPCQEKCLSFFFFF